MIRVPTAGAVPVHQADPCPDILLHEGNVALEHRVAGDCWTSRVQVQVADGAPLWIQVTSPAPLMAYRVDGPGPTEIRSGLWALGPPEARFRAAVAGLYHRDALSPGPAPGISGCSFPRTLEGMT